MSNTDLISRLYETSQALEHLAQHLAELEVDNTEAEAIEADSDDSENLTEPVEAETEAETKAEIEIEAKAENSTSAETENSSVATPTNSSQNEEPSQSDEPKMATIIIETTPLEVTDAEKEEAKPKAEASAEQAQHQSFAAFKQLGQR